MLFLLTLGSKPWTSVMLTLIFVDLRIFIFIPFRRSVFFTILFYNLLLLFSFLLLPEFESGHDEASGFDYHYAKSVWWS